MKIRKLHLKNIGVFDDEEINFQECPAKDKAEIHILTGENGTGKTTILQALANSFEDMPSLMQIQNSEKDVTSPLKNRFDKRFRAGSKVEVVSEYFLERADGSYDVKKRNTTRSKDDRYAFPVSWSFGSSSKPQNDFHYAVFAYSGQRHLKSESIQAVYEPNEFAPLKQSLDFIKDYTDYSQISINQLITNNLSKQGIEYIKNNYEKADRYKRVISSMEQVIIDVTELNVAFDLQTDPLKLYLNLKGEALDFDVLPDGLRSLISWIADLLGRVDLLKWADDLPITEKNLILLLDEIEVHLHPAWQRKILPVVQKLFKNAQIFVSTHSPFVVNSVDDAWVYKLKVDEDGKAKVASVERSEDARSYRYVLRNTFDIENEFGIEIENRLKDFYQERDSFLRGNGNSKKSKAELKKIANELSKQSKELKSKMDFELFQLSEITGEDF